MQRIPQTILGAIAIIIAVSSGSALAEEFRRDEGRHGPERHMVFDNRHGHGHYYPALGFAVSTLPVNAIRIGFGRERFFFQGGVWYQPRHGVYVVVRAPIGISVPVLPLAYTTVWAGGVPYYYANDVYYAGNPGNYVVVAPPANFVARPEAAQPAPPPPAPPGAPGSSMPAPPPGTWYYCDSSKAYYPYVAECPTGWRVVPATPPR